MKTKTFFVIAIASLVSLTQPHASAATIPAGAALVVRTLQAIASVDVPGTTFTAQLENNVTVNGKVVLPAGTKLSGKIATSRRSAVSTQRLTVDITEVQVGGRSVPIKTTGAYQLDNENFKTSHGTPVGRVSYTVAAGRRMEFRLAQPLKL